MTTTNCFAVRQEWVKLVSLKTVTDACTQFAFVTLEVVLSVPFFRVISCVILCVIFQNPVSVFIDVTAGQCSKLTFDIDTLTTTTARKWNIKVREEGGGTSL